MKEEEKRILDLLALPVKEAGYDIVSLSFNGGREKTLAIVLDRVAPISMEDIVAASNLISDLLDEEDPIDSAYTLDVSSLGAEKPIALDKLPLYVGKYVNLHLSHPYKGENILEGTLLSLEEGTLRLEYRAKTKKLVAEFPASDVDKARLAIEF